ncbi:MAG TPA: D-alanyl-D-alanine carboxypeptidase [Solirubrobacteraceae bacterium]|nr:D-alanyl-D-alanine carboxypeptidase [Solirubrobacteraceae bacterium]
MPAGAAGMAVAVAILVVALSSSGASDRSRRPRGASVVTSAARAPARPGRVGTAPLGPAALDPGAARTAADARLAAALNRSLAHAGPATGALVYDLGAQHVVYARRPDIARPPASVEKLYTTVAVLRVLGPDARLHTTVMGTGHQVGSSWHGDLYLRGGGDPTFGDAGFVRSYYQGQGATVQALIAQLRSRGIRRVTGKVYADESMFDRRRGGLLTGYATDTPDFLGQLSALDFNHGSALKRLGPARFAVKQFVLDLRATGIRATVAKATAATPPGAVTLASTDSPPIGTMTREMDVPSDDLFAELFAKQLGYLFGGGGTISDGAAVIRGTISAAFGLHPVVLDGSGLSRDDRSSPADVVDLLRDVWHTAIGRLLYASLPRIGLEGTVKYLAAGTAAQGRCRAKTGTLNDVTNLAGYCQTPSGRDLAFALMLDGPSNASAITLEARMVAAIARY